MKNKISYESLNIELKQMFESGITTYKECEGVVRSKYQMGNDRFSKQYREAHSEWVESRKNAQDKVIHSEELAALKEAIISKNEALIILSEIAKGKEVVTDEQIIVPSPSDKINAIRKMAELEGWNAPTKQDLNVLDKTGAEKLFIEK